MNKILSLLAMSLLGLGLALGAHAQTPPPRIAAASPATASGTAVTKARQLDKIGLDPNHWFNNVEIITAEKIGIETTTCARNIFKHYVAYTLAAQVQETAAVAKDQFAPMNKRAGGSAATSDPP